jgi:prevent-host-death family protein
MSRTNQSRSKVPRVAIGELKARLSEYVARARGGEEITITDRGRPVARLSPLSSHQAAGSREAELIRSGLARAPTRRLDAAWLKAPRPKDPTGRSLEFILEERAEGW